MRRAARNNASNLISDTSHLRFSGRGRIKIREGVGRVQEINEDGKGGDNKVAERNWIEYKRGKVYSFSGK